MPIRVSAKGSNAHEWDKNTWPELEKLARLYPEAGVHFQGLTCLHLLSGCVGLIFVETVFCNPSENAIAGPGMPDSLIEPWYKDTLPNVKRSHSVISFTQVVIFYLQFGLVPKDCLPPGIHSAYSFTSVCINTAIYLPWLVSQCLQAGVNFKRHIFAHVSEAANVHHSGKKADLIVNCTGLSASNLGGVEDKNMVPVRGQTVLVRNDPGIILHVDPINGKDELCYVMKRAAGKPPPSSP